MREIKQRQLDSRGISVTQWKREFGIWPYAPIISDEGPPTALSAFPALTILF
jgi:hypothetical protein